MIRGALYRIDLGNAKRGHEQRGHRFGLALSPSSAHWTVATVVPTSTRAQPATFRPLIKVKGEATRLLVDQLRSIDTRYVSGEPVYHLDREELAEVEHALRFHLGL